MYLRRVKTDRKIPDMHLSSHVHVAYLILNFVQYVHEVADVHFVQTKGSKCTVNHLVFAATLFCDSFLINGK
jgi:hypothetical protein